MLRVEVGVLKKIDGFNMLSFRERMVFWKIYSSNFASYARFDGRTILANTFPRVTPRASFIVQ